MSVETWGLMPKSQSDDQTIDEAIAAAIVAHEEDSEAHQGEGESLQNHKSDIIIDHPAESVVQDKYAPFSQDPFYFNRTKIIISPLFESVEYLRYLYSGEDMFTHVLGRLILECGPSNGDYGSISLINTPVNAQFQNKNPMFEVSIDITFNTYNTFYALCGNSEAANNSMGFKIQNGTAYCFWRSNGTTYTESIPGLVVTTTHRYRCQIVNNDTLEFYVDNQLVYSTQNNLPLETYPTSIFFFKLITTENDYKGVDIISPIFIQDL